MGFERVRTYMILHRIIPAVSSVQEPRMNFVFSKTRKRQLEAHCHTVTLSHCHTAVLLSSFLLSCLLFLLSLLLFSPPFSLFVVFSFVPFPQARIYEAIYRLWPPNPAAESAESQQHNGTNYGSSDLATHCGRVV